jgi:hypothetical protein
MYVLRKTDSRRDCRRDFETRKSKDEVLYTEFTKPYDRNYVYVGKRQYLYIDPFQYSALYGRVWGKL